jgi:hypothetical protein
MPFICKRRLWWEPVPDAVTYVVQVLKGDPIPDPAKVSWEAVPGVLTKLVFGKTELIIPDEWPEFPAEPGNYQIAIKARDEVGNQSDPFVLSGRFKFVAPPAPSKGGIESLPLIQPRQEAAAPAQPRPGQAIIRGGLEEVQENKLVQEAYLGGGKS